MALELAVAGLSRPTQPWTLSLYPEGLRLTPQQGGHPSIHILRGELATHVQLLNFGPTTRTLMVRKPVKRNFKMDAHSWPAFTDWIGRDARLRMALRQRFGLGIWVAAFILLTSIPMPGDAAAGIEPKPFDPLAAVLGVLLIAGTLLSRWRPHPAMFLVDSVWFAGIAVMIATQVAYGGSPLWLIVVVLQLVMMWSGISLYRDLSTPRP